MKNNLFFDVESQFTKKKKNYYFFLEVFALEY